MRAYEGMPETLLELRERGVHLAVCTNKPHPAAVGAIHGICGDGLFDVIQGQMPVSRGNLRLTVLC